MSYSQLPNRSSADVNASADVNTLQDNIEALKGGVGATAPTTTIEDLSTDKADKISSGVENNIVTINASENIKDSGVAISAISDLQATDGLVKASDTDTSPGSLTDKLVAGSNITLALVTTGTGGEQEVEIASTASGGSTESDPIFDSGNYDYPTSNAAPLEVINSGTITNIKLKGQAFDDTTNESVEQKFEVPSDLSSTGSDTVTFYVRGIAQTAATANVEFRFAHSAAGSGEQSDVAYTNEDSGAKAVDTNQDYYTYFSWTETITNLGWSAGDSVKFQLTRLASGGNDTLTDDFYVTRLRIAIPRS
jgi:hypothetical protein